MQVSTSVYKNSFSLSRLLSDRTTLVGLVSFLVTGLMAAACDSAPLPTTSRVRKAALWASWSSRLVLAPAQLSRRLMNEGLVCSSAAEKRPFRSPPEADVQLRTDHHSGH